MQDEGSDPTVLHSNVLSSSNEIETQKAYDVWASLFDRDLKEMGLNMHVEVAKCVTKYGANKKDTSLLDVAGGTGLVGYCLRKNENFLGEIDILDANMEMLYKASKNGLNFRNIIRHWIEGELPLAPKSYDVVTCIGAFVPLHLPPSTMQNMLKLIKDGGYLIFNMRTSVTTSYVDELLKMIGQLENEGKMKVVETKEILYTLRSEALLSKLYVCQVPK